MCDALSPMRFFLVMRSDSMRFGAITNVPLTALVMAIDRALSKKVRSRSVGLRIQSSSIYWNKQGVKYA